MTACFWNVGRGGLCRAPTYRRLRGLLFLVPLWPQLGKVLQLPALLGGQLRDEPWTPLLLPDRWEGWIFHVNRYFFQGFVQVKLHFYNKIELKAKVPCRGMDRKLIKIIFSLSGKKPSMHTVSTLWIKASSPVGTLLVRGKRLGLATYSPKALETGRNIRLWILFLLDLGVI